MAVFLPFQDNTPPTYEHFLQMFVNQYLLLAAFLFIALPRTRITHKHSY
jgi:hypothetical protein